MLGDGWKYVLKQYAKQTAAFSASASKIIIVKVGGLPRCSLINTTEFVHRMVNREWIAPAKADYDWET